MIIRTYVPPKKKVEDKEIKIAVVKEEVKKEEFIPKKKHNKKSIPAPAVEEIPAVVEEEEHIDLSEWLKEDIDE